MNIVEKEFMENGEGTKIWATDIDWDTDSVNEVGLPDQVEIPFTPTECEIDGCEGGLECEAFIEEVNNYLSDEYGWCVNDYKLVEK